MKHYLSLILIFVISLLCLNFECDGEDDLYTTLTVEIDPSTIVLDVGDTIWFAAAFNATLGDGTTLSENGGMATIFTFQLDSATNQLTEAVSKSNFIIDDGAPLLTPDILDEAGNYFRYECPQQNCSFRVGWQPQAPGLYLVQPQGLGYETIQISSSSNPSNASFDGTFIRNAPDYSLEFPWLLERFYRYEPNTGFTREITFFSEVELLFFEVR